MTGYDEIAACATAYQDARAARAGITDLTAAEAVLRARVGLAECLIAAGWTPPPKVANDLTADRGLLLQPMGAVEQRHHEIQVQVPPG